MNKEEFKKLLKEVIKSGELEIVPVYKDNGKRKDIGIICWMTNK